MTEGRSQFLYRYYKRYLQFRLICDMFEKNAIFRFKNVLVYLKIYAVILGFGLIADIYNSAKVWVSTNNPKTLFFLILLQI